MVTQNADVFSGYEKTDVALLINNIESIFELRIYRLSLFITHDDFNIADPSSMQDTCHT